MIYALVREARLIVDDQRDRILPWNVRCRDNDEFAPGNVRSEFHADDLSAWNFTPHRDTVDQPGKREVVNILGTAGYLVSAFFSRNRLSDDPSAKHESGV